MKYKIVGWINLVFGSLFLIQQVTMLFFVYPKLSYLYDEFGADLPLSTRIFPYLTTFVILVLVVIVWIGAKLVSNKIPNDKFLKLGIAGLIVLFLFGGYYFSTQLLSIIFPLYSITSNLQP